MIKFQLSQSQFCFLKRLNTNFPPESSIWKLFVGEKNRKKSIAAWMKSFWIYSNNLRVCSREHICWSQRGHISYHECRSSRARLSLSYYLPIPQPKADQLAFTSHPHKSLFIFRAWLPVQHREGRAIIICHTSMINMITEEEKALKAESY